MRRHREAEEEAAQKTARVFAERSEFAAQFTAACDDHVRPPMEAILERLRVDGGDGVIVERPEDLAARRWHRLTLWMSINGPISGTPWPDRYPYLQLDADVDRRAVKVSEGDMWLGHGGNRSGPVATWRLSEMTADAVTDAAIATLGRSAGQGGAWAV